MNAAKVIHGPLKDRLTFDVNVSEASPVIKGTSITAHHINCLFVDGFTIEDIAKKYRLSYDDVLACMHQFSMEDTEKTAADAGKPDTEEPSMPTKLRSIPLDYNWSRMFARYANQFTFQTFEDVCYLNFFEAVPPQIVGSPEEIAEQVNRITSIRAEGVARIVVTKAKLREILAAIQARLGDEAP